MGTQNRGQILDCFSAKLFQFLVGVGWSRGCSMRQSVQCCCCQCANVHKFFLKNVFIFNQCRVSLGTISGCFRVSLHCSVTLQPTTSSMHCSYNLGALQLKSVFPSHCNNLIRKHWIHLLRSCSTSVYPVEQVSRIDGRNLTSGQPVALPWMEPVSRLKKPCCM